MLLFAAHSGRAMARLASVFRVPVSSRAPAKDRTP